MKEATHGNQVLVSGGFPPDVYWRMVEAAKVERRPVAAFIRQAVMAYLDANHPEAKP